MRESLKPGSERDALIVKANTIKQVKELISPLQTDSLKPNTEADLVYLASADMAVCEKYGQVFTPGSADPSKCYTTGCVEVAAVGEKSTAILQAVSFEGKNHVRSPSNHWNVN